MPYNFIVYLNNVHKSPINVLNYNKISIIVRNNDNIYA
jgi:hypothetical protein